MKPRSSNLRLLAVGCFCSLAFAGCVPRPASPSPTPTTGANGATVIGRIILGYGDHRPVADLPLWLGTESRGEPVTRTNAAGEFVLTNLPVGQIVNVVDDHLFFQVFTASSGITDVGTLEYPLVHPPVDSGSSP